MKLKTYLRGLGIGIIVTTIVMAVALGGKKEKLSDEEIVVRAKQLGMVESSKEDADNEKKPEKETNIADAEGEKEPQEGGEPEEADKAEVQDATAPESESKTESQSHVESAEGSSSEADRGQADEQEENPDSAEEERMAEAANDGEVTAGAIVNVSIASGDDSATVSKRLAELDLVISATQFDQFLCDNGYAKKISPGDYEIAIGASEETIAKIITKSR